MAKGANQKLKLLYLSKIFLEETDEAHGLTLPEITGKLAAYGISADRKTLYADFEDLRHFGLDIINEQVGRQHLYYIGAREFELPELKLLVDAVQASKFITARKSQELIRKLESLVSRHEAGQLQRQVYITGRVKTMNESIYYNVDKIHTAIGSNAQIRFQYCQWNMKKELEPRHGGKIYQISPWGLLWDDDNYYMLGYDPENHQIRHYRVDKMQRIGILDEKRQGRELFEQVDPAEYTRRHFRMFTGEVLPVTMEADIDLAGVFIDRFGKDIILIPLGENRFRVTVEVAVSDQFLGWVLALGDKVTVIGPDSVTDKLRELARALAARYARPED